MYQIERGLVGEDDIQVIVRLIGERVADVKRERQYALCSASDARSKFTSSGTTTDCVTSSCAAVARISTDLEVAQIRKNMSKLILSLLLRYHFSFIHVGF